MHRLFAKAMYWRFIPREINPIALVELAESHGGGESR
jgi:hypothetical protein